MTTRAFKILQYVNDSAMTMAEIVRALNNIQSNVALSLNPLTNKVQNDPTNLQNISLKAGQVNKINHTLGRKLLGYNVMLKGPAIVWNDQDNNPSPQLTLWLWTDTDVICSLEVY